MGFSQGYRIQVYVSGFNKTSLLKPVVDGGVIKVKALFGVSCFSFVGDKIMTLMPNDEGKSTLRFRSKGFASRSY
jgi:hypothetical protein